MFRPLIAALALFGLSCAPSVPLVASAGTSAVDTLPTRVKAAQVVGVTDGDTLTVLMDGQQVKVRLNGIDTPEKGQAFGKASKGALSALVFGQQVSVMPFGKDRYRRTIAEVFAPDGRRVSLAMVQSGMAWHIVKHAPKDLEPVR